MLPTASDNCSRSSFVRRWNMGWIQARAHRFGKRMSRDMLSVTLAIVTLAQVQLAIAQSENSVRTPKREDSFIDRDAAVMRVLADLVQGYRSKLPELVMSQYATMQQTSTPSGSPSRPSSPDLVGWFRAFRAPRGCPLVYIARPRIIWTGEEAQVRCTVVWNVEDVEGRQLRFSVPEEFTMGWRENRFRIIGSRTTPLVTKYSADFDLLKRRLNNMRYQRRGDSLKEP